jgi:D-ribose pyranose/furanose isomerase RbsD
MATQADSWHRTLKETLPLFGHRNWIVVADAAYPVHSSLGITTVLADGEQIDILRTVLDEIASCRHVSATAYTDLELGFVDETEAHGASEYRGALDNVLSSLTRFVWPHEEIIERLDTAAGRFQVLIIKTRMCIPYTSVFLELGCGYWPPAAERALHDAIRQSGK